MDDDTALLKFQIELLTHLVDSERDPFAYLCLEMRLTRHQKERIFALMDEAKASLRATPMDHSEFERRVYEICPAQHGDYHFAESIVSSLNKSGRWPEVFKHMQANGMNLSGE